MQSRTLSLVPFPRLLAALLLAICSSSPSPAQPSPAATDAFDIYCTGVERRLASQHATESGFVAATAPEVGSRLRRGEVLIETVREPNAPLPDAQTGSMLQHWRGTAFVRAGAADDFEHLLRNVSDYPRVFAPEVLRARLLASHGDGMQVSMRVRQHHVLTVTLDSTYDISFGRNGGTRWSTSRSSRVAEIADPGTPQEHVLNGTDEHGFLYRLNTYWTWVERDGGLYLQIETVSLSRGIPVGLAWALKPYVASVPRDSLAFTLRSACHALNARAENAQATSAIRVRPGTEAHHG